MDMMLVLGILAGVFLVSLTLIALYHDSINTRAFNAGFLILDAIFYFIWNLGTPYTGYRVLTYKNRYSKETNKLLETVQERDFTYSHRDKVVVKFIGTEEETTPPTTP